MGEHLSLGRPSGFSQEIADQVCEALAEGKSVRTICRQPWAPDMRTIFRWLDRFDEFRQQYARACEMRADAIFEEALEIADTCLLGEKRVVEGKGDKQTVTLTTADMVERSRLQVETRKWFLSKLMPKKYGDKQETQVTVINGDPDAARKSEQAERLIAVLQELADKKARGEPIPKLIEGEVKKP
jgi:hypothetical protein